MPRRKGDEDGDEANEVNNKGASNPKSSMIITTSTQVELLVGASRNLAAFTVLEIPHLVISMILRPTPRGVSFFDGLAWLG